MNRKYLSVAISALTVLGLVLSGSTEITAAQSRQSFGFNNNDIAGFPTGTVFLTGGGAYVPGTTFLRTGGAFRCLATVNQGPLTGCLEGQGVRWDAAALLASSTFKCTGSASEPLKTATTNDTTVVMVADFYRQGDGNEESFTAKLIVSQNDLDPARPGIQTVWIQGVGCGTGIANFN